MAMAGRRRAFQNNRELQSFVLHGVRPTGRQLGVGSYGSVEELEVNGVVCAGKRLHEVLLEQGNAGVAEIARKYLLECQVMARMRHPHVVQFLGLCYLEESTLPVLVMERLYTSLDDLLESSPGLPLALKLSLLTDVARGLVYIHTRDPPIIHRDLSARNVLLTSSMVAKISDLGNARIVNLQPGQLAMTQTCMPGTWAYMPPESFDQHSRYGPRLDIFSFGHLALFTLTQVFPGNLLHHTYSDPDNPGCLLARSEVERRRDYIQPLHEQLGEQHPLVQLVCQCLHNTPAHRPSAEELLQQLEAVRPQVERAYGRQHINVEIAKLQVTMMSVLRRKETEVGEKDSEIEQLRHDLQQVQEDRERLQAEVEAKNTELQQRDTRLQQKDEQLQQKDEQLQQKDELLQQKDEQIRQKIDQLQQKDDQFQQQGMELQERIAQINSKRKEFQTLKQQAQEKDAEINSKQRELQALKHQAREKDAEINSKQRELQTLKHQAQEKDAEINSKQRELQTLKAEMDARNAEVERQIQERDDEINRLWRERRTMVTMCDMESMDDSKVMGVQPREATFAQTCDFACKIAGGTSKILEIAGFKRNLAADFKADFLSTCKAVDVRLRELDYSKYKISDHLDETGKKQILIGVFGCYNCGKSTLLNCLLGARVLPMKEMSETGQRVIIKHKEDYSLQVQSSSAATKWHKTTLYSKYAKWQSEKVMEGTVNIYKKLQSLNADVRRGHQEIPVCTLETCVPFLAGVPSEWQVNLVDTPGFGEFDSRVEELIKSSSICVYLTTYNDLHAHYNADYLKFILGYDQGIFEGNRLIIVITQFDRPSWSGDLSDTEEEISEEEAKEKTCQFVRKICPSAKISHDDVLPVSGKWAYHARMLANSSPWELTHYRCQSNVRKCLADVPNRMCAQGEDPYAVLEDSKLSTELEKASGITVLEARCRLYAVPNSTCGQGEDPNMSLAKLGDDELSAKLEEASGIITLGARIRTMIESYVKTGVWVYKVVGDYDKHLTQAMDKMKQTSSKLVRCSEEHQKSKMGITMFRKQLDNSMMLHENSKVYGDIAAKCLEDCEAFQESQLQLSAREVVHRLISMFRSQCLDKVKDKEIEFGPTQFETDLKLFLENTERELEKATNSNFGFAKMYQVLVHHVKEMRAMVGQMRASAEQLCTSGIPDSEAATSEDETQEYIQLKPSNLGEKVQIPAHTSSFRAFWQRIFKREEEVKPKSSYREWDRELEDCMTTLQEYLEKECDAYILKIKKDPVKYFYDQYCRETRSQLQIFDEEFKEGVEKQLMELEKSIDHNHTEIYKLDYLCTHLHKLATHLHNKAQEYMHLQWQ